MVFVVACNNYIYIYLSKSYHLMSGKTCAIILLDMYLAPWIKLCHGVPGKGRWDESQLKIVEFQSTEVNLVLFTFICPLTFACVGSWEYED